MHFRERFAVCSLIVFSFYVLTNIKRFQSVFSFSYGNDTIKKPHIIFILADDLGWSEVGYNNPYVITPTIDKLAREGVILNQTYVSPSCSPTRAAILSGYFPYRLGFQDGGLHRNIPSGLPLNVTTLPEEMKKLGYSTYMVGKWHLGFCKTDYTPTRRGFDHFYGYYLAAEDHYTHSVGSGLDLRCNMDPDWSQNGIYSSHLFSDKAANYIAQHDKSKPMFMYLAYQSVHSPLQVPKKYINMYPSVSNEKRRIKLGMISAMDEGIGKVVRALQQHGLWRDTLLVFSSDNGAPQNERAEGNNWPLRGTKGSLHEGGTRVVGFVHGNILQRTGYVNNGIVHAVDWYPTLSWVAGAKSLDTRMDGINVWNALSQNKPSPRKEFVYNILEKGRPLAAIRVGNYKLMMGYPRFSAQRIPPPEAEDIDDEGDVLQKQNVYLFNVRTDPLEKFNLAEEMPHKVQEMAARIEELKKKLVPAFDDNTSVPELSDASNFAGVWSPGWCS